MTVNTFPTFPTFLTFGLVCAGWPKLVTKKTGGRAIHWWQVSALLFRGTYARKVGKARKAVPVMRMSTFPTFLTFVTRRLRFAGTWESFPAGPLERHESLGPLTGILANEKASR